jgi:hypothetical protein
MSNYLAIATVSAALKQVLATPVSNAVNNASVHFGRPDANPQQSPLVNIYLYQVTPNAAYRNGDLPTRRADGTLAQRPQAALDLHYLLTFQGDDEQLEPQRLLGAVVTALQNQPLLSAADITSAVTNFGFLAGSGLDSQVERVKFTPTALSLEEFSKLWSAFFQVEYRLSIAYQASVVLLESDVTPQSAPPVVARNLNVTPFRFPRVDQVISQAGAELPIVTGTTLLIRGANLRGPMTFVLLEGVERAPTTLSDTQITYLLPAGVHAGVQALQVVQKALLGRPAVAHRGFESNVVPFVLRPAVTPLSAVLVPTPPTSPTLTAVTVQVVPNIGPGQRAILLLNDSAETPPTAYSSPATLAAMDTNQIEFQMENVPPGTYLVRVQIDGAESLLTVDPNTNSLTGPTVTMP